MMKRVGIQHFREKSDGARLHDWFQQPFLSLFGTTETYVCVKDA